MKTTNYFIELLVIGSGVFFAILGIIAIGIGLDNYVPYHLILSLPSALMVFFSLTFVYVLGIIFDRLFDKMSKRFSKSDFLNNTTIPPHKFSDFSEYALKKKEWSNQPDYEVTYNYFKTRIRICRAYLFVFGILGIETLVMFLQYAIVHDKPDYILGGTPIALFFFLLSWLSYKAWRWLKADYFSRVNNG